MDVWALCRGHEWIQSIAGQLVRVVESLEQIATNALVDSLEEQALLETLLDASKPPGPAQTRSLNYLLSTPFRYPPLPHGSRFGARFEPALFYAGQELHAALAETAYYRLVFWSGMAVAPPTGRLTTAHSAFGAAYRTSLGVGLHSAPFSTYETVLTDPAHYGVTQQLGAAMRAAGVQGFEYRSARDPQGGINVALFSPDALVDDIPAWQQSWLCDTRAERVSFYSNEQGTVVFDRQMFTVCDRLPTPAV